MPWIGDICWTDLSLAVGQGPSTVYRGLCRGGSSSCPRLAVPWRGAGAGPSSLDVQLRPSIPYASSPCVSH